MSKLEFIEISVRNFRSVGNIPMTVNYTENDTTLVTATQNGSGKSTLLQHALYFALFGKPYGKKSKKGGLVNSHNNKNCEVELYFKTKGKSYKVIRGMKPNVFDIWCDGEKLDEQASSSNQQTALEQITGLTETMFVNTVALGKDKFVPFVEMTAGDRRKMVEDILDLTVFTRMNELAKEDVKSKMSECESLKRDAEDKKAHISILTNSKADNESTIQMMIKTRENRTTDVLKTISEYESELQDYDFESNEAELQKLNDEIKEVDLQIQLGFSYIKNSENQQARKTELNLLQTTLTEAESEMTEYYSEYLENSVDNFEERIKLKSIMNDGFDNLRTMQNELSSKKAELSRVEREYEAQLAIDTCDKCGQKISSTIITDIKTKYDSIIDELKTDIHNLSSTTVDMEMKSGENESKYNEINELEKTRLEHVAKYESLVSNVDSIKNKLVNCQRDIDSIGEIEGQTEYEIIDELNNVRNLKTSHSKSLYTTFEKQNNVRKSLDTAKNEYNRLCEPDDTISKIQNDVESTTNKIKDCETNLIEINKRYDETLNELKYCNMTLKLLSDTEVKAQIIEQYIPFINAKINDTLIKMNMYVDFSMDMTFNIELKDPTRKNQTLFDLSSGQKAKINIAILMAFREVARLKSSTDCNILILDEILEPLAQDSVADCVEALKTDDIKLWVISQRHDEFAEYFDKVKRYKLVNDFTTEF